MTARYLQAEHYASAGRQLKAVEDFQRLAPGSVILDFSWGDSTDPFPEVYQKQTLNTWNLPGDDMSQTPYSDAEMADRVERHGVVFIVVYAAVQDGA